MSEQDTTFSRNFILSANGKKLDLRTPAVMAIVNLSPDSFYDGKQKPNLKLTLKDAELKIKQGAKILDVGAVSTRPGAPEIPTQEELKRLLAPLKEIRKKFPDVFISVDTTSSEAARRAADLGADIINDISAGEFDEEMIATVAKLKLPYILMHTQGRPATMQIDPHYKNVTKEVRSYLKNRLKKAKKAGIYQLIVDPGFGFGKTLEHNYQLLAGMKKIAADGYPVLAGVSRKGMISKLLNLNSQQALNGTSIVNTIALLNGASVLRVHDVAEAMECIRVTEFYKAQS